eukprot:1477734-Rhodomonas_salina.1
MCIRDSLSPLLSLLPSLSSSLSSRPPHPGSTRTRRSSSSPRSSPASGNPSRRYTLPPPHAKSVLGPVVRGTACAVLAWAVVIHVND